MSRLDEPIDPGSVQFSAQMTVDAHAAGRPCYIECPGEGCGQAEWARDQLQQARPVSGPPSAG